MRDTLIHYFKLLTSIDSPSGREGELADKLSELLGAHRFSLDRDGIGNIIARRGQGQPLLLCCHMDTVESSSGLKLRFDGDYITTSGETILGADDKAGIAILLAVLDNLACDPALEILLSVQEETGMKGTKVIQPGALKSQWGLVLDAAEPVGAVINQAPGEMELDITIHGRGAHAAADPEKGIDAIRLAAKYIESLPPARIAPGTTFNLGIIRGGKSTNTICPRVRLQGEIRSFEDVRRREIARQLESLLERALADTGGKYEFVSEDSYSGYAIRGDHGLIELLKKTGERLKISIDTHPRFAGSDANILNSLGVVSVNLGIGVEDGHSFQERVSVSAMVNMAKWLLAILKEWCHGRPDA
ncbi:MAG: M20/M25/M40 family metallo-hydrolase [Bacillota bacterium]|jgi:tripeptide aminopeptidase